MPFNARGAFWLIKLPPARSRGHCGIIGKAVFAVKSL